MSPYHKIRLLWLKIKVIVMQILGHFGSSIQITQQLSGNYCLLCFVIWLLLPQTLRICILLTFQIRAAVPIRKGEHIAIMYSDPMWATANRQNHLYETKYFRCKCPRCTDPTELGTEFSSIKCQTCPVDRHGYLAAIGMNIFFSRDLYIPEKNSL